MSREGRAPVAWDREGRAIIFGRPQRFESRKLDWDSYWVGFASGLVVLAVVVLGLDSLGVI